jgi:heme-degrading monooxygenase HmoA
MKRRDCLKAVAALAGVAGARAAGAEHPIQLHVDLVVDPAKEKEMLRIFQSAFRPAASQQAGFIDAKMLKLRSALKGSGPAGANYRFVLVFASEELRQKWIATDIHKKVWPAIEATLASKEYTVLLYDAAG